MYLGYLILCLLCLYIWSLLEHLIIWQAYPYTRLHLKQRDQLLYISQVQIEHGGRPIDGQLEPALVQVEVQVIDIQEGPTEARETLWFVGVRDLELYNQVG